MLKLVSEQITKEHEIPGNEALEQAIQGLLSAIGEDPKREDLVRTPQRFIDFLKAANVGIKTNAVQYLSENLISIPNYNGEIVLEEIPFVSLCAHHLMPFFGKVRIEYVPRERILGLGRISGVVEIFAKRLQIQEKMTMEIAEAFMEAIKPEYVKVSISAKHFCIDNKGAELPHFTTNYQLNFNGS